MAGNVLETNNIGCVQWIWKDEIAQMLLKRISSSEQV